MWSSTRLGESRMMTLTLTAKSLWWRTWSCICPSMILKKEVRADPSHHRMLIRFSANSPGCKAILQEWPDRGTLRHAVSGWK